MQYMPPEILWETTYFLRKRFCDEGGRSLNNITETSLKNHGSYGVFMVFTMEMKFAWSCTIVFVAARRHNMSVYGISKNPKVSAVEKYTWKFSKNEY